MSLSVSPAVEGEFWELGGEVDFLEQPVAPAITLSNTQQLCFSLCFSNTRHKPTSGLHEPNDNG